MRIRSKGIANKSSKGELLDVYFSTIEFGEKKVDAGLIEIKNNFQQIIEVDWDENDLERPIETVSDAYLKLHLLSNKFVLPNSINLDGLFSSLTNVVWTNQGPVCVDEINDKLHESKINKNNLYVRSLDKFPCLTDYIIPKNVRIADASRVRLGAYLSEGTTIMHEGFVNFNAGTLGPAMIEGRISAGVTVGKNSDIGGGASTMGTLSGGNDTKISIGENSLLGANAGIGISLGDNCTVEAGLYITAGTKITILDDGESKLVKASEISGISGMLFLRDSSTGKVIAKPNKKISDLNKELHNTYAYGKLSAENYAKFLHSFNKSKIKIARCFTLVGPYQMIGKGFAIVDFISLAIKDKNIKINSPLKVYRSYMFVADLIIWLIFILLKGEDGKVYNVGSDKPILLLDLAKKIVKLTNSKSKVIPNRKSLNNEKIQFYIPDIEETKKTFNLDLWTDIDQSIISMVNSIK